MENQTQEHQPTQAAGSVPAVVSDALLGLSAPATRAVEWLWSEEASRLTIAEARATIIREFGASAAAELKAYLSKP